MIRETSGGELTGEVVPAFEVRGKGRDVVPAVERAPVGFNISILHLQVRVVVVFFHCDERSESHEDWRDKLE